jgi:hypothetical protein
VCASFSIYALFPIHARSFTYMRLVFPCPNHSKFLTTFLPSTHVRPLTMRSSPSSHIHMHPRAPIYALELLCAPPHPCATSITRVRPGALVCTLGLFYAPWGSRMCPRALVRAPLDPYTPPSIMHALGLLYASSSSCMPF